MRRVILSEKTLLPISAITVIASIVYMFARVSFATETNRKDLDELTGSVKEMQTSVMVDLRDQSATLMELRAQILLMDVKLSSMDDKLNRMRKP